MLSAPFDVINGASANTDGVFVGLVQAENARQMPNLQKFAKKPKFLYNDVAFVGGFTINFMNGSLPARMDSTLKS